ncbi:MAG: hypothetical protein A2Y10_03675 [Planctomycetes bacterium GWF2_41_51]|nr:MAG: hypothetical protein A2Y10_03675 [Planctomycetes bacterium GWF2_41_51]HBG28843.1 hypothetical protein [Phycisphaerales bacterium]
MSLSSVRTDQELEWYISMGLNVNEVFKPLEDWRLITNGNPISSNQCYADQPFIVQTDDDSWLCTVTTGKSREGQSGQHVISLRSKDHGITWTDAVEIEPSDGPAASYSVTLKTPTGRIYCFYNHNTDNHEKIIADKAAYPDGFCRRVDSLGYFVFKYSDDHGKSWSKKRYVINVREMEIDRQNAYAGKIRFFWNVGKPFKYDGAAYVSLHKVGGFGHGFFTKSEGVLLKSDNLLTELDPEKIHWETLPEGETGLRTPPGGGPISEEQSYSVMSDGSFFCVYRTVDGHPVCTYSRDKGRNWSVPEYMAYTPDGKKIKHPRAANFAWKCSNGKYLYWFHNHGGKDYNDRNPVWLCCGSEIQTAQGLKIEWSQPEIVLYSDDIFNRMSYPDMVECRGAFYLTETQKQTARIHKINPRFINNLFSFKEKCSITEAGIILDITSTGKMPVRIPAPQLPALTVRNPHSPDGSLLDMRNGFTIDIWVKFDSIAKGQVILENINENGKGFCVTTDNNGTVQLILNDGRSESCWKSDPKTIKAGHLHHIVIIVDGGPKIICFVIDGILCDGDRYRQFGWGRYNPNITDLNTGGYLYVGKSIEGYVKSLRLYNRALMINEAVGNFRAEFINSKPI